ncbi:XK-related protein 4 [Leptopilina heterotoma]|uniref:XK-related protein 4 n=1 Tax=Leptopilina heterotoma TaxID=63436 RepID=UPI001CA986C5|nr:XK-related protein 4 [Leptopilina heterotoma]
MTCEKLSNAEEMEIEESPCSTAKLDVTDMPSKKARVSNCDVFFLVMPIITHIIDIISDINVARHYIVINEYSYFASTIIVILVPSLINNAVSYRMRQQDREKLLETSSEEKRPWNCSRIFGTISSIIFQVAPLRRYWTALRYGLASRKCQKSEDTAGQKQNYLRMVKENEDIALITILECFLETAPQQVLQCAIILTNYQGQFSITLIHQILCIVSSFISMGWSMASYNCSIRLAQNDKLNIGNTGTVLQFLWHLLITVSRIITFATTLMLSTVCTIIFIVVHWFSMTMWIIKDSHGTTEFCRNREKPPHANLSLIERFNSTCFSFLFGFVYNFAYVNFDESSTYMRHFIYYTVCIIENMIVCVLFILTPSQRTICFCLNGICYNCVLPILCLLPYVIGVAIMITYYLFFHPSRRQKVLREP